MSNKEVRVRFAPSPTGGLHLGGVRTVLYNYLFAKKNNGKFIVRVEDTDQSRYVTGAEEYIFDCLNWCGLPPDESVQAGGPFAPYRQSERKESYRQYAEKLIKDGHAYYAFDTPEEIEKMREELKAKGSYSLQYDHTTRMNMNNSLRLLPEETEKLLAAGTPHVIRIKINPNNFTGFTDMIRGEMKFENKLVDDKVLLKADGMPTYHLAVVVDDYLMGITHAFRGEEWMPSAPVHILLWEYLFGLDKMPEWAHLPLILKPDGNGKLSKRDGDRLGIPVFAMDWYDEKTEHLNKGFKELGFLPEAFLNLLAVLGWNDGTEQEIFSLDELIEKFSIEKVHHSGAKFNYEKAKWFNQEWIKRLPATNYSNRVKEIFTENGIAVNDETYFLKVLELVKDRCTLLPDFLEQAKFFFEAPAEIDFTPIQPKWNADKKAFFIEFSEKLAALKEWNFENIETTFKDLATAKNIKPGELQLPFRLMLVGGKYGPAVFAIAEIIGKSNTQQRIENAISKI